MILSIQTSDIAVPCSKKIHMDIGKDITMRQWLTAELIFGLACNTLI